MILFSAHFGQSIHNDRLVNFPVVLVVSFSPNSIADEKKHKIQKPPALRRKKNHPREEKPTPQAGFGQAAKVDERLNKKDRFQSLIRHFKADMFVFHRTTCTVGRTTRVFGESSCHSKKMCAAGGLHGAVVTLT